VGRGSADIVGPQTRRVNQPARAGYTHPRPVVRLSDMAGANTAAMESTRVLIHGRVQGVYYRASMREEARRLGVRGWVRNRADGSVEALAEGDPDAVARLVDWCRSGPSGARVTRVDTEAVSDPDGPFETFAIRH